MKNTYLKRVVQTVGSVSVVALFFLVSTGAQSVKFNDAASYYRDAKCAMCHGQKAEKHFNSDLNEDDLVQIVLKGKKPEKPPNMPAYEDKGITADQAKALVDYMKSLKQ